MEFVFSKKALSDLEQIWLYSAERWGVSQADRYYQLILDEINYICKNIHSGKSMDHVRKGYRATKVKSHLIFYRVVKNTVEVVRILHEGMDVEGRV